MMEYRGIKLHESVRLYNEDGSFYRHVKNSLDKFADRLTKENHTLHSEYRKTLSKVLIDFKCEHGLYSITPHHYIVGNGCKRCASKKMNKKKVLDAKEKFEKTILENGHVLLSEYQTNRKNVLINFKCEHEPHWVLPSNYTKHQRCPSCNKISPKEAKEDLLKRIKNNGHELLSEYVTAISKVLIDFKCGHEPHWMTPNKYKSGRDCPICAKIKGGKKKSSHTKKDFSLLVKSNGHILLSEYVKSQIKVLIDFKCEHEPHWITPNSYMQGSGCFKCGGKDLEEAKEDVLKMVKANGHKLLSDYINAREKILIDFKCGHEPHWITSTGYKKGQGCSGCADIKRAKTRHKNGKNRLIKLLKKNGHILLSDYKGATTKVLIDFTCEHKPHWITPDSYKQGSGCPRCALGKSKGEGIIEKYLSDNHIEFKNGRISENTRWLYDIIIPSHNLIVEVHGKQHYEEVEYFSNRTLEQEQENDRNKRRYAESLGYNYMEVDYREHKPKLTLKRFLNQFNQLKPIKQQQPQQYEQLTLF